MINENKDLINKKDNKNAKTKIGENKNETSELL